MKNLFIERGIANFVASPSLAEGELESVTFAKRIGCSRSNKEDSTVSFF